MFKPISDYLRRLTSRTPLTHAQDQNPYPTLSAHYYNPKRPYFTVFLNQAMLVDPRIQYGLYLIKGPIYSRSRFIVKTDNEQLRTFIVDQLTRFWRNSAMLAMECLDFGWYGCEIMYRYNNGLVQFDRLEPAFQLGVSPYVHMGHLTGLRFRTDGSDFRTQPQDHGFLYVNRPKCFWAVHNRKKSRWFGQSRLYGSHIPWNEYNAREGFRDCRQLFYYKCAFNAGKLYYPHGSVVDAMGNVQNNSDVAGRIMELYRTGSTLTIPRTGNKEADWAHEDPQTFDLGDGFRMYGEDLKQEMLEGMGVPPEVAAADGTGALAGRQVPFEAFYSMLEEISNEVITDFDDQILQFLIKNAFGAQPADYSIESLAINTEEQTQEKTNWALANQDKMPAKADGKTPNPSGQPIENTQPSLYSLTTLNLVRGTSLTKPEEFYDPDRILFGTGIIRNAT